MADTGGAAVGGAVGVLSALAERPGLIGATTGGTTSVAQDLFNGRIRSLDDFPAAIDRAADATSDGNAWAILPGAAIARKVRAAPPFSPNALLGKSKKQLGEMLSPVRTAARFGSTLKTQDRLPVTGGHTVTDAVARPWFSRPAGEIVETKFDRAKLTKRQNAAHREYINYRTDHFTPHDLGALVELPAGFGVYQWGPADRRDPQGR